MGTDLVTRLILDNKNFDDNLKKSKSQVSAFSDIGKSAVGMLGKFAGAIGIVTGSAEVFNRIINGSQTTGDAFNNTMASLTTTVNTFFTSLSTGDFSSFDRGLSNIISKAFDAQTALDQLGNTIISYDYLSGKNNADFDEQLNISKDLTKTKKEREDAAKQAKQILDTQREYSNTLSSTAIDAVKKVITLNEPYLKSTDISIADVEGILKLDVSKNRDKSKGDLADKYKQFLKDREDIISKHTQKSITDAGDGKVIGTSLTDWGQVNKEVQALIPTYKQAILYNNMLVKMSDDELTSVTENLSKASTAQMTINTMERKMIRVNNRSVTGGNYSQGDKNRKLPVIKQRVELEYPEQQELPGFDEFSIKVYKDRLAELYSMIENAPTPDLRIKYTLEAKGVERKLKDMADVTKNALTANINEATEGMRAFSLATEKALTKMRNKGKQDKEAKNKQEDLTASFENYAYTLSNADFSSKEGRQAVANDTIESIKALIIAKVIESCMSLPFPANIIAAPLAAVGISGLFSLIPKFATGGIIAGNSTIGDMNLARVNSGEMILNNHQLRNLFNLLNNGSSADTNNSLVEFKISGRELVGVLKNYNNKISKVQ